MYLLKKVAIILIGIGEKLQHTTNAMVKVSGEQVGERDQLQERAEEDVRALRLDVRGVLGRQNLLIRFFNDFNLHIVHP